MNEVVRGAACGAAAGALSGVFGIGGGIVLVPLLALALGVGQHEAQGISLAALLLPIGLPAVLAYRRKAPIRWRLVALLVAGFVGGVGAGALVANRVPDRPLEAIFAAFLAVVAALVWKGREPAADGARRGRDDAHGLWIGAIAGLLSGLLGIGGGIVMVGLLVAVLGLSQHEANGTSLATMLPPIGLPGVIVYARSGGGLPWVLLAGVVAGFAAGAWAGARVAVRIESRTLGRALAALLVVAAAAMVARSLA